MWKYKVDEEHATKLAAATVCEICGGPQSEGKLMCVDHNHDTGKVRGSLCDMCNKGLGQFRDNIHLITEALKYLNKYN